MSPSMSKRNSTKESSNREHTKMYSDITCSSTFEIDLLELKTTVMHWFRFPTTSTHTNSDLLNKTHEKQLTIMYSRRSICSQCIPSNTTSLKICTKSISHKSVGISLNTIWEIHDVYMSNIHRLLLRSRWNVASPSLLARCCCYVAPDQRFQTKYLSKFDITNFMRSRSGYV